MPFFGKIIETKEIGYYKLSGLSKSDGHHYHQDIRFYFVNTVKTTQWVRASYPQNEVEVTRKGGRNAEQIKNYETFTITCFKIENYACVLAKLSFSFLCRRHFPL